LRLTLELPERRYRIEDPSQFGVLRHLRLDKKRADVGIETGRQQRHRHLSAALAELLGFVD
jgi:hypothetical protein